jgi:hypothetical protein
MMATNMGLGIEAQRAAVSDCPSGGRWKLIKEWERQARGSPDVGKGAGNLQASWSEARHRQDRPVIPRI